MPSRLGARVGLCLLFLSSAPTWPPVTRALFSCQTPVRPWSHCVPRLGGPCPVSSPCGRSVPEGSCWTRTLASLGVPGSPHRDCQSLGGMKEGSRSQVKPRDTLCVFVCAQDREAGRTQGATATASGASICAQALLFSGSSIAFLGHIPLFIIH